MKRLPKANGYSEYEMFGIGFAAAAALAGGRARVSAPRLCAVRSASGVASRFSLSGPLLTRLHRALGPSKMPDKGEVQRHGAFLAARLDPESAAEAGAVVNDQALRKRICQLYLPVYFWARDRVTSTSAAAHRAVGIGLSAPQGCGKTTLVELLVELFEADGLRCVAVSFDDFYKTGAEQDAVAAAHPSNPLLQVRGNAGTHDLPLGSSTLRELVHGPDEPGRGVPVPRYDKAARGGRGDRQPREAWPVAESRADVVLLEGWMAGFDPLPAAELAARPELADVAASLAEVNRALREYRAWHAALDAWIVLGVRVRHFHGLFRRGRTLSNHGGRASTRHRSTTRTASTSGGCRQSARWPPPAGPA